MGMKRIRLVLAILSGLLLAACGGGGESDSPSADFAYTGPETQATISSNNAESLAEEMFGLEQAVIDSNQDASDEPKPEPYNLRVPIVLREILKQVESGDLIDIWRCDEGYIEYTFSVEEFNGALNGSLALHDCELAGLTLTGSAEVTGSYDLPNSVLLQLDLYFPWLRGRTKTLSYVAGGVVEFDFTAATIILRDWIVSIDDRAVTMFQDFILTLNDAVGAENLSLFGLFFHPSYGYTEVITDDPLYFTPDVVWPFIGTLEMDGHDSALKLECTDSEQYTLWVDGDDADDEWDSADLMTW
jgi:hypothetical protein